MSDEKRYHENDEVNDAVKRIIEATDKKIKSIDDRLEKEAADKLLKLLEKK